jgi:hypothetical protein
MKRIILSLTLLLSGCGTVLPVVPSLPVLPQKLAEPCPALQKLNDDAKLSDVSQTVHANYMMYYKCAIRHDMIVEWYNIHKQIFDDIKEQK